MSDNPKIWTFNSLKKIATRFRADLQNKDYILLYAYNGTGKTRLSMEFKELGKKREKSSLVTGTGESENQGGK